MNCAECRDEMAACLEDLLDAGEAKRRQLHLQNCAACRAEFAAFRSLQQLLRASAATAADVALEHSVMQRIRQRTERTSIMRTLLKYRWGFGLGAAATCALIIALAVFSSPNAHAKAADVMARGAKAVARLTSLHLRGELRTLPADNFSYINPDQDFQPIELWKQFTPELKWRA
ncbi:MAG TPA: hypothetical protein VLT36_16285, partial [Candidatus Dormibacteraeota bacterium]|nr:hypothetical protein [Candidatus Dormibacteraeota bacterium]